ncbi:hypothetical protein [Kitasatospora sp. LaBMicrA B282]|uniref:hypothetical protein n=1 Tax=Kitasatospora sp. LaBMicrA B282 TaxID=3420949 RepID=UPI003D0F6C05
MTSDPVFVIHGVGNRDRAGFTRTVADLQAAAQVELVPVYWGDLGADDRFVELALPWPADPAHSAGPAWSAGGAGPSALREDGVPGAAPAAELVGALLAEPGATHAAVQRAENLAVLHAAVQQELADRATGADTLRGGSGGAPDTAAVLAAIDEAWPRTQWLSSIADPQLLAEAAAALADLAEEAGAAEPATDRWAGGSLRDAPEQPRGLRRTVERRLLELDRVAGAALAAVAGRVNQALRSRFGPGTTRFLGDVLVYQRHRATIHARVRAAVDAVDPALGRTPGRPVRVVAHSLGGVIAVDMATADQPLWTSELLTFGSQAAFFHLCDPRGGQLAPHSGTGLVALPASLARWTNLWEPLDVLAFRAAGVFRLADGGAPTDLPVGHLASTGLWTHSAYWEAPEVAATIGRVMRGQLR